MPPPTFVSARELHEALRAQGTHIGLATVYRNLALLVDVGELDTLQRPDGGCSTGAVRRTITTTWCAGSADAPWRLPDQPSNGGPRRWPPITATPT